MNLITLTMLCLTCLSLVAENMFIEFYNKTDMDIIFATARDADGNFEYSVANKFSQKAIDVYRENNTLFIKLQEHANFLPITLEKLYPTLDIVIQRQSIVFQNIGAKSLGSLVINSNPAQ